jgi:hypothetical protein
MMDNIHEYMFTWNRYYYQYKILLFMFPFIGGIFALSNMFLLYFQDDPIVNSLYSKYGIYYSVVSILLSIVFTSFWNNLYLKFFVIPCPYCGKKWNYATLVERNNLLLSITQGKCVCQHMACP